LSKVEVQIQNYGCRGFEPGFWGKQIIKKVAISSPFNCTLRSWLDCFGSCKKIRMLLLATSLLPKTLWPLAKKLKNGHTF